MILMRDSESWSNQRFLESFSVQLLTLKFFS